MRGRIVRRLAHLTRAVAELLAAVLLAPILLGAVLLVLFAADVVARLRRRPTPPADRMPDTRSASVVIPNWNGRDLLETYLHSVVAAMAFHPANEILVVDNGSTDDSVAFLHAQFPQVTVLALPTNRGFGGGSNAGFRAAKNDVVVLLNSDMRVAPDFLAPLLAGFTAADVFAVSCQIYLSDPLKRREETGLTEGWWERGRLRVSHRDDTAVDTLFPCFYAGGGSSAFDRAKFLDLGGFDDLLAPFYLEDTDLGFLAWKRGWKVFYQPASVVWHEHRGTIGRKFSPAYIDSILQKNYLLFTWKNVQGAGALVASAAAAWGEVVATALAGSRPLRTGFGGLMRAVKQLPQALQARAHAHALRVLDDAEAFTQSRGAHFRDRFFPVASGAERLRVLFVSPYPILPPVHGGAVFMLQTVRELAAHCDVHALVLLDEAPQAEANRELARICASVELRVRPRNPSFASMLPHAVEEFASRDVQWLIDRMVFMHRIDIVQIEYTAMGQYAGTYRRVVTALFEHDVYFQSIARATPFLKGALVRAKARFEYLRALRYELKLLPRCDQVQVCTEQNRELLLSFDPSLASRVKAGLRAAIDTRAYDFPGGPREPDSILFVGSSRHKPNLHAIQWFVAHVLDRIAAARPAVRLYLAGFDARSTPDLAAHPRIQMLGYVEDVRTWLRRCALFACPVLSGSGVRVKLLEAFASGIPVVSTRIGAEGLASEDGRFCALADSAVEFADKAIALLKPAEETVALEETVAMATRARVEVECNWDSVVVTARLVHSYRALLEAKRDPDRPV